MAAKAAASGNGPGAAADGDDFNGMLQQDAESLSDAHVGSDKANHLREWVDTLNRFDLKDPQVYAINGYP